MQLKTMKVQREEEVSILQADLESEKDSRRGLQDKVRALREALSSMVLSSPLLNRGRILTISLSAGRDTVCACVD